MTQPPFCGAFSPLAALSSIALHTFLNSPIRNLSNIRPLGSPRPYNSAIHTYVVGPLVSFRFVPFAIAPLDALCDGYAADLVSDRVPCTEISLHEGGMCHESLRGLALIP